MSWQTANESGSAVGILRGFSQAGGQDVREPPAGCGTTPSATATRQRCAGFLDADHLVLGTNVPCQNGAAYQRAIGYITTCGLPRRRRPCPTPAPGRSLAGAAHPRTVNCQHICTERNE
jgi:hypothetical protein